MRRFRTFLGVDLGGGKGRTTAVARLRVEDGHARVVEVGTRRGGTGAGPGDGPPFYDDVLTAYLREHADDAALAVDAPLTTTACVRCRLPECRTIEACDDPTIVWFRDVGTPMLAERDPAGTSGASHPPGRNGKPAVTPYTQRACEVILQMRHGVPPRETLGQGMGPLTARAAYLRRALEDRFRLGENLIEVYPRATLAMLFGRAARRYRRHPDTWVTRAQMLEALSADLRFDVWREGCLANDHCFDAVIAAYTGYLWARDGWDLPDEHRRVFEQDGWIWFPAAREPSPPRR